MIETAENILLIHDLIGFAVRTFMIYKPNFCKNENVLDGVKFEVSTKIIGYSFKIVYTIVCAYTIYTRKHRK